MDDWTVKPWKTFADKAIALRRAIGADGFPVISRDKHPKEWREWYAYYGFRRMLASQELMRAKPEKTVPTLSPFDFDVDFNLRHPAPDVPRDGFSPRPNLTPEQRERHQRLYPFLRGNAEAVDSTPKGKAA